jgi:hypothetical protein
VEKLARYVDKEEKIWVKLIFSAHVLERISQVASTGVSFFPAQYHMRVRRNFEKYTRRFENVEPLSTIKLPLRGYTCSEMGIYPQNVA